MITMITGWPKTGKTTTADNWPGTATVIHTDDYIDLGWSEASLAVCQDLEKHHAQGTSDLVIEGVAVPRVLRKFIARNPGKRPCDRLIILGTPHEALSAGQEGMGKGHDTVLAGIKRALSDLTVAFANDAKMGDLP